MFDAPFFTKALDPKITGDDPLGTAPTNERMFGAIYPGINNVVRYIRVYSALCWTVDRIDEYLRAHDGKLTNDEALSISENALQKIQLALLWRNQGMGYTQLAGLRRQFPDSDNTVRLVFSTFGTNQADLLDPGAYKPSLTRGLGFLETDGRLYRCTPAGKRLAAAFDELASAGQRYRWLKDVTALNTRRRDIFSVESALSLSMVTDAERDAFIAQFFPPASERQLDQLSQNRWLAIHLALRAVQLVADVHRAQGGTPAAGVAEIRACMARAGCQGKGLSLDGLETVQAWWAVLQVRQLQRLALDTLFCAAERLLARKKVEGATVSVDELAESIAGFGTEGLKASYVRRTGALISHYQSLRGSAQTLYDVAEDPEHEDADVFAHMQRLAEADIDSLESLPGVVCDAFLALAFCAAETQNLANTKADASDVLRRDLDQCSLRNLADLFIEMTDSPSTNVFRLLAKHWVVLRHFSVVTTRSQSGPYKNRFRYVVGDDGLERFNPAAGLSEVAIGNDRLEHILLLCAQSGILKTDGDGLFALTTKGRRRMRELWRDRNAT